MSGTREIELYDQERQRSRPNGLGEVDVGSVERASFGFISLVSFERIFWRPRQDLRVDSGAITADPGSSSSSRNRDN